MFRFFRFFPKPVKDTFTNTGMVLASTLIGSGIYTLGNTAYDFGSRKLTFFSPYFGKPVINGSQPIPDKELEKAPLRCHS